jgi:hypothetical protein
LNREKNSSPTTWNVPAASESTRPFTDAAEGRGSTRANVGVELKGVRSGVERRRGVCVGIESEGPWAERNAGKSP